MEALAEKKALDLVASKMDLGTLETNADDILAYVEKKVAGYTIENYSSDRLPEAKKDKAELNASVKTLNAQRLELERRWMKPFEDRVKSKIDKAVTLIATASTKIDTLVKDVEQGEKDEKRRKIEQFFTSKQVTLFTLEKVFNPAWLNKAATMKSIEDEILTKIKKVDADLLILDKLGEPAAKDHYLDTFDLSAAMAAAERIKANRTRLEAAEKAKAEANPAPRSGGSGFSIGVGRSTPKPEAQPAPKPEPIEEEPLFADEAEEPLFADDPEPPEPVPAPSPAPLFEYTLRLRGTQAAFAALRVCMTQNDITYEKIEEGA